MQFTFRLKVFGTKLKKNWKWIGDFSFLFSAKTFSVWKSIEGLSVVVQGKTRDAVKNVRTYYLTYVTMEFWTALRFYNTYFYYHIYLITITIFRSFVLHFYICFYKNVIIFIYFFLYWNVVCEVCFYQTSHLLTGL